MFLPVSPRTLAISSVNLAVVSEEAVSTAVTLLCNFFSTWANTLSLWFLKQEEETGPQLGPTQHAECAENVITAHRWDDGLLLQREPVSQPFQSGQAYDVPGSTSQSGSSNTELCVCREPGGKNTPVLFWNSTDTLWVSLDRLMGEWESCCHRELRACHSREASLLSCSLVTGKRETNQAETGATQLSLDEWLRCKTSLQCLVPRLRPSPLRLSLTGASSTLLTEHLNACPMYRLLLSKLSPHFTTWNSPFTCADISFHRSQGLAYLAHCSWKERQRHQEFSVPSKYVHVNECPDYNTNTCVWTQVCCGLLTTQAHMGQVENVFKGLGI